MDAGSREEAEANVKRLLDAGDVDAAATATLRAYGREIFGFLIALHRSEQDATDVFSLFSEKLWRGLAQFHWESSLRTWAYTIARNTSFRFKKRESKGKNAVPLDGTGADDGVAANLAEEMRSVTASYLKTERKDQMRALRDALSPEEKTLLILRIDRKLAWDELAQVMAEDDESRAQIASPEGLKKEAARLRQRFQTLKEKLSTLGKTVGLKK